MKRDKAQPRPPDERTALYERLRWQRQTVRKKAKGLSEADAHRAFLPSPLMTVAGLVSHLRWNEHSWFETCLLGLPDRGPWTDDDPDAEMRVDHVPLARLLDEYDEQCARSVEIADSLPLDALEQAPPPGGEPCSLRWILLHLIEETARHNGHLDIMREFADGVTGE
ncbi:DinB family protein [Glycomyces tenuis]|uniref:DinB family protein n=1 Tax=Glycomyces tenuis TaxID=58116 RepID=UPI0003F74D9E|nr:DinB family protein [Glycomyces tenuis]